jgi:hypothetical protein
LLPIARRIWKDGKIVRNSGDYAGWVRAVADAEHAPFLDVNNIAADQYDRMVPDDVILSSAIRTRIPRELEPN